MAAGFYGGFPWVFTSSYGYPRPAPLLRYGYPYGWAPPAAAVFMPVSVVRPVAPPWYQGYMAQQAAALLQMLQGYLLHQVALQSQMPLVLPLVAPEGPVRARAASSGRAKTSPEFGSVSGSQTWRAGRDESGQWSKSA